MLDIIRSDGIEGANVRAITRGAGVTEATLYRYFPDKKSMFHEVWQSQAHPLTDMTQDFFVSFDDASSSETVSNYVREIYTRYDSNPAGFSYAILSASTRKWRSTDEKYQEQKRVVGEYFQKLFESGSVIPMDAYMARRVFISTTLFIPRSIESGQITGPAAQYADDIIAVVHRMLGLEIATA